MPSLLVVEDHESLNQSICDYLREEGFEVHSAKDLERARTEINKNPSLIILDWMLPDGQGLDFLKELRAQSKILPVIFLTARADLVDKVLGLELGANDYMTKPFEPRELVARIRACLRDSISKQTQASNLLKVGSLCIDKDKHLVTFKSKSLDLVRKEFDLLSLLAEYPEKVFSRDELLNKVWGYDVYPTTRTVDTHIMLLRQKTEDGLIETVRAVGYRLRIL